MKVCQLAWIGKVDKGVSLDAMGVVDYKHEGRASRYHFGEHEQDLRDFKFKARSKGEGEDTHWKIPI